MDDDTMSIDLSNYVFDQELHSYDCEEMGMKFCYIPELCTSEFMRATMENNVEKVKKLLFQKNVLGIRENNGCTVLHIAVYHENMELIDLFLQHPEVDLNAINFYGDTPLHLALGTFKKDKIIEKLMYHLKCDINIPNSSRSTPLHLAIKTKRLNIAKNLLQIGADLTYMDNDYFSPLHYIYKKYGLNEELEKFALMNLPYMLYNGNDSLLGFGFVFVCANVNVLFTEFLEQFRSNFNTIDELLKLFRYVTPNAEHYDIILRTITEDNAEEKILVDVVFGIRGLKVPSLIELSRNAVRTYISSLCNKYVSGEGHEILNNFKLPDRVKDMIKLKVPLYPPL